MNARRTRAQAGGLPPRAPPAPRRTPRAPFPAAPHAETAAETACQRPTRAPQLQLTAEIAPYRHAPAG